MQVSRQSSTRPVTTFGTGTREQAGQVLAPGFKGYAPRSTIAYPGPGAYRNVPGSLGLQVETLPTYFYGLLIEGPAMTSFVMRPLVPVKISLI